jgi:AbrB family looped-hinge helix DNA binding protein
VSKITSKLQVTIPKSIADQFGIAPGDEIDFQLRADRIVIIPRRTVRAAPTMTIDEKLAILAESWQRQLELNRQYKRSGKKPPKDRGWTREDLQR